MFFDLSKLLAVFTLPSNLMFFAVAIGTILLFTPLARAGRRLAVPGVLLMGLAGFSPLGNLLIWPLEQRFPRWDASRGAPDGIVVLGGAVSAGLSNAVGETQLNEAAERMTTVAGLAQRFPKARIVFSGGDGTLLGSAGPESVHAQRLFETFGITRERIELEGASRNTAENASLSKAMVKPKPGERWLLVTSAHHMPRSVGCFRAAGFSVEPYPVDWRTHEGELTLPFVSIPAGLARVDVASREWVGLLVYWLTGRTSELFPGPA